MKLSLSKNSIINSFFFLFTFILICYFFKSIIGGFSKESWQITEFLINYEGGFVRRGLLGEIILYVYNCTGINPYITIISTCIIAYMILIWFFVKSFVRNGYTLFVLPFVFFLGNPIISDFLVRKDVLLILIFLLIIFFSLKKSNWNFIPVNLFLILGLLIHEAIGFFCFPILLLILNSRNKNLYNYSWIKTTIISCLQILPAMFIFLCVLYFKGSQEIAFKIWESWKPIGFPIQAENDTTIPAAIDGISWSLKQGLSLTINTLKNFNNNIYAPMAWTIIIVVVYYISINTPKLNFKLLNYIPTKNFNRVNMSNILVLQLLAIIPLFILGWDYSRWIFYWVTSSFAIILLVPEEKLSFLFPQIFLKISTSINNILDLFLGTSFVLPFCLLIGFSPCSWSLTDTINSNSFIIIIRYISNIIYRCITFS